MRYSRREFLRTGLRTGAGLAAAPLLAGWQGTAQASSRPPNVVLIVCDDLGWRDLGCYGSAFYETPRIDALAKEGVLCTNAYAACPVCSPTRVSLMTGKHPARLNTTDWFGAPQPDNVESHWTRGKPLLPAPYVDRLLLSEQTLAEILGTAGYASFFAGKWHLGGEGFWPEAQGFGVNKGGHRRGSPPGGYFSPYENPALEDGPEGEHLPMRLAAETSAFIQAQGSAPFLAVLSFYSVHTPLQAPRELIRKYRGKRDEMALEEEWGEEDGRRVRLTQNHPVYAAMIESMDAAVGHVLDTLESQGIAEETLVLLTSDNGGLSTSEGHPTSNAPLRAGKGWLYEGGIRVPLIARGPGLARGRQIDTPITSTDAVPTVCEAAGAADVLPEGLDGDSMLAVLQGNAAEAERSLYWHYPHYGNQGGSPSAAIRRGRWKLLEWFEDRPLELYDLASDVGERRNLAESHAETAAQLRAALREWQAGIGARFPAPNHSAGA